MPILRIGTEWCNYAFSTTKTRVFSSFVYNFAVLACISFTCITQCLFLELALNDATMRFLPRKPEYFPSTSASTSSRRNTGGGSRVFSRFSLLFSLFSLVLLTAYCLLLTAYCLLLTAYCLLLTVYCLLLTAYCLSTPYWLLLTAYCLQNFWSYFWSNF